MKGNIKNLLLKTFLFLMAVSFFSLINSSAEAVTPKNIYLQADTYMPCGANGNIKFKAGTNVTVDSANRNNVITGTLAADTILGYTLSYSPNPKVPSLSAKFKAGTTVNFITGTGNEVGLVTKGTLAEDTSFHVYDGSPSFSSTLVFKAGGIMDLPFTSLSGYPASGMLASNSFIHISASKIFMFKGGTYVKFFQGSSGSSEFLAEGTLNGAQALPFSTSVNKLVPDGAKVSFTAYGFVDYYILPNGTVITN